MIAIDTDDLCLFQGDVLTELRNIAPGHVQTVITSPAPPLPDF